MKQIFRMLFLFIFPHDISNTKSNIFDTFQPTKHTKQNFPIVCSKYLIELFNKSEIK